MARLLVAAAIAAASLFGFLSPVHAAKDVEPPPIDGPTVYWWGICGGEDDDNDPRDNDQGDKISDKDKLGEFCATHGPGHTNEAPSKD